MTINCRLNRKANGFSPIKAEECHLYVYTWNGMPQQVYVESTLSAGNHPDYGKMLNSILESIQMRNFRVIEQWLYTFDEFYGTPVREPDYSTYWAE